MSSSFQQQQAAESTRAPRQCAGGCSFFGSPETLGMCSACYKTHCNSAALAAAPRSAVAAAPAVAGTAASSTAAKPGAGVSFEPATKAKDGGISAGASVLLPGAAPQAAAAKKKAEPTRCAACYKKVGLLGFVCRCNKTFCGTHRHAEEHGCSFDFKGAGRDAIARSNPLIKGEKLTVKI